ncbi:CPXV216 protein [Cowpox virus]|uniref:CPXV216 protein n=1 Tax=Cowpox virus (strain Brighton Red) TaxID=265872 RepID=Q8QMN2_CWPXB|nr:CPXV216 protein [Cowpox virus]AAM13654.1 CPXV216 protein [Cowpox virus]UWJ24970.1 CPXV216 [Cowpox virus]
MLNFSLCLCSVFILDKLVFRTQSIILHTINNASIKKSLVDVSKYRFRKQRI